MGTRDLPPDDPVLAWLLLTPLLGFLVHAIHVRHPLAQVVVGLLPVIDSVQLEEGGVRALVTQASLVANKYPLVVQPIVKEWLS